jgi:protein phosphatase
MKILAAGKTDKGKTRKNNEDAFLVEDRLKLFAVADGIGGHQGGEVASRMAVETLRETVSNKAASGNPDAGAIVSALKRGFELGNSGIIDAASDNPALNGMGTTLTALFLTEGFAHLAHIGDSRAYLLREERLEQVSEDHGVVAEQVRAGLITPEQARKSPYRHVITRALGIDREIQVDQRAIRTRENDIFLLCSDGLTEMVEDHEIARILRDSPSAAAEKLINAANNRGGVDNITVVVLKILG